MIVFFGLCIWKKDIISLLFHIQNNNFFANDFFKTCIPTLSQLLRKGIWKPVYLQLCTGPTPEHPSQHDQKIVDWNVKNQNLQNNLLYKYS